MTTISRINIHFHLSIRPPEFAIQKFPGKDESGGTERYVTEDGLVDMTVH